jgi:hypothetical protein
VFFPKPITTKQVPLSVVGPGGVGIFFLPSYPAACTEDPVKLDTIAFFAGTMQSTFMPNHYYKFCRHGGFTFDS